MNRINEVENEFSNEFSNNAPAPPGGGGGEPAKVKKVVEKRKNIMENIAARSMRPEYNADVQGKKNEKQLADKVKFFEAKEAAGELKNTFRKKKEDAIRLLAHVRTLRATPLANRAAVPALEPRAAAAGVEKAAKPKTLKAPKEPKAPRQPAPVIENEHLLEASEAALPLPELHDPFTGRKFAPEENPMPPIEDAYKMLKKLHTGVMRKAATLRKKAAGAAAKPNNGGKKGNNGSGASSRRTRRTRRTRR